MTRRSMFSAMFGLGSVAPVAQTNPPKTCSKPLILCKDCQGSRWEIGWSGWRTPTDSMSVYGWWEAKQYGLPDYAQRIVSTAGGIIHFSRPGYSVNLSCSEGWPWLESGERSAKDRESSQSRAFDELINRLRDIKYMSSFRDPDRPSFIDPESWMDESVREDHFRLYPRR